MQHPCPKVADVPQTDLACISKLVTDSKGTPNLGVERPVENPMVLSLLRAHVRMHELEGDAVGTFERLLFPSRGGDGGTGGWAKARLRCPLETGAL